MGKVRKEEEEGFVGLLRKLGGFGRRRRVWVVGGGEGVCVVGGNWVGKVRRRRRGLCGFGEEIGGFGKEEDWAS